jgi:hypothetical protein
MSAAVSVTFPSRVILGAAASVARPTTCVSVERRLHQASLHAFHAEQMSSMCSWKNSQLLQVRCEPWCNLSMLSVSLARVVTLMLAVDTLVAQQWRRLDRGPACWRSSTASEPYQCVWGDVGMPLGAGAVVQSSFMVVVNDVMHDGYYAQHCRCAVQHTVLGDPVCRE